jgi:hypothetical protein
MEPSIVAQVPATHRDLLNGPLSFVLTSARELAETLQAAALEYRVLAGGLA